MGNIMMGLSKGEFIWRSDVRLRLPADTLGYTYIWGIVGLLLLY